MDSAGLLDRWERQKLIENAVPCLNKIQRETNVKIIKGDKKQLTLQGLSGSFLVLGVGYIISVLVFIIEIIWHFWQSKNRNQMLVDKLVKLQPSPVKDSKAMGSTIEIGE